MNRAAGISRGLFYPSDAGKAGFRFLIGTTRGKPNAGLGDKPGVEHVIIYG
jgi:hypothetical protein